MKHTRAFSRCRHSCRAIAKPRKGENAKSERMKRQPSTKGARFGCLLLSRFHSLAFSRSVPQCWTQGGLLKSPPASSQLRFPVLFRRKCTCRALARTFQDRIGDATPAAHQRAAASTIRPDAPIRLRPDEARCWRLTRVPARQRPPGSAQCKRPHPASSGWSARLAANARPHAAAAASQRPVQTPPSGRAGWERTGRAFNRN
jgi:hypothetical protein